MASNLHAAKQDLMDDFSKVVTDAEALLRAVRDVPGEKAQAMRASLEATLDGAKARLVALQHSAVERTTAAARAADGYVHENPWPMIGAAALVGFVLGLMVRNSD